ncbi:MAG: PIN domain-containing protein [Gemmatimonadaceae bacterium]
MTKVFLDTSGWFAALSPREGAHEPALTAYRGWLERGVVLVTTNLVIAEMHILLSRFRGAKEGLRFLDSVYQDAAHEVVFVDRDLERAAIDRWLRRFTDHPLSLADATSFEVMRAQHIRTALALDTHFQVAGYSIVP